MKCDLCKKQIRNHEGVYVLVTTSLVRFDPEQMGQITFEPKEKNRFEQSLECHRDCWREILRMKKSQKDWQKIIDDNDKD